MKRPRAWHQWLFPLFPAFFLWAHNAGELTAGQVVRPLAVLLAAGLVVGWAAGRATREPARGAVLASLFWLWLFGWGPARQGLDRLGLFSAMPELGPAAWLLLLCAAGWWLLRSRRPLDAFSRRLDLVAVLLVLLQLVTIGAAAARRPAVSGPAAAAPAAARQGRPPSVCYLVLDSYARADTLARLYGYDNRPFLDFLRSRGFVVAERAAANYDETALSLASSLNLGYLDRVAGRMPAGSQDRTPLYRLIRQNRLAKLLDAAGYRVVTFSSGCDATEQMAADERINVVTALSELERLLYDSTFAAQVLEKVGGKPDQLQQQRRRITGTLAALPGVMRSRRPVFAFAHVLCPHPPYVFLHDGSPAPAAGAIHLATGPTAGDRALYERRYVEQLQHLNTLLRQAVDQVLAAAPPDTIIVLTADHGTRMEADLASAPRTNVRELFGILCAVRLPESAHRRLGPAITPVNVTRAIAEQCTGNPYPPLPDRSYYSPWFSPYHFTEVTARLRQGGG